MPAARSQVVLAVMGVAMISPVALVAGCAPHHDEGPLRTPAEMVNGGTAVTYVALPDPRARAVGNIRVVGDGGAGTITGVRLTEPVNVHVDGFYALPLDAGGSGPTMGSGYPIPPAPDDDGYEETAALWAQRDDAVGYVVGDGQAVNLVVGLRQADRSRCASADTIEISYTTDEREHVVVWPTTYVLTPLGQSECPSSTPSAR